MSTPLFSIAIAAYNYGHYLPENIRSVLMQTYRDFEILICDDSSTDNTWEVAQHYEKKDSRVRCIQNSENLGSRKTINRCYREAKGTFIIPLQADDAFLLPDYLDRLARLIRSDSEIGFIISEGLFVSREAGVARYYNPLFGDYKGPGELFACLLSRQPPWPSFTAIRKTLLDTQGGENESLLIADFELTLRIACNTKVAYLRQAAVISRVHDQAQGIRMGCAEEQAVCKNNLECLDAYLKQDESNSYIHRVIEGARSLYTHGHRRRNNDLYNAEHLCAIVNPLVEDCRKRGLSIALYASGEHSKRLLEWTSLTSEDLLYTIDSNPKLQGCELGDGRILNPSATALSIPDYIVVSSASYQDDIDFALTLSGLLKNEPVLLYPSAFTGKQEANQGISRLYL